MNHSDKVFSIGGLNKQSALDKPNHKNRSAIRQLYVFALRHLRNFKKIFFDKSSLYFNLLFLSAWRE